MFGPITTIATRRYLIKLKKTYSRGEGGFSENDLNDPDKI